MPERDKRQKASDIFREGNFVFSEKVPFREAFPQIDAVTVFVKERGRTDWREGRYYDARDIGEYLDCGNSLCYAGGFSIGRIIRDMVTKNEVIHESNQWCKGNEGSPKGRRIYRKCMNSFEVKVEIKYKEV